MDERKDISELHAQEPQQSAKTTEPTRNELGSGAPNSVEESRALENTSVVADDELQTSGESEGTGAGVPGPSESEFAEEPETLEMERLRLRQQFEEGRNKLQKQYTEKKEELRIAQEKVENQRQNLQTKETEAKQKTEQAKELLEDANSEKESSERMQRNAVRMFYIAVAVTILAFMIALTVPGYLFNAKISEMNEAVEIALSEKTKADEARKAADEAKIAVEKTLEENRKENISIKEGIAELQSTFRQVEQREAAVAEKERQLEEREKTLEQRGG